MEIVIIGAGALGGLFAALLAPHAGVTLLTSNRRHLAALRDGGLRLIDLDGGERVARLPVIAEAGEYTGGADLVLICTKARATAEAAESARQLLAANGQVLTLQNGLGNLERIAAVVGAERALAGITAQGATLVAPGCVRHAGSGPTVLAEAQGRTDRCRAIASLFNRAGIETGLDPDWQRLLWSKLLVNVGINALSALLRVENGVLAEVPACDRLMEEAVDEALAVAEALGLDFDRAAELARVRGVCRATARNRSSMLQDLLRGAPTEIGVINGAVVATGREAGVATPVNLLLVQLIEALEATTEHRVPCP